MVSPAYGFGGPEIQFFRLMALSMAHIPSVTPGSKMAPSSRKEMRKGEEQPPSPLHFPDVSQEMRISCLLKSRGHSSQLELEKHTVFILSVPVSS